MHASKSRQVLQVLGQSFIVASVDVQKPVHVNRYRGTICSFLISAWKPQMGLNQITHNCKKATICPFQAELAPKPTMKAPEYLQNTIFSHSLAEDSSFKDIFNATWFSAKVNTVSRMRAHLRSRQVVKVVSTEAQKSMSGVRSDQSLEPSPRSLRLPRQIGLLQPVPLPHWKLHAHASLAACVPSPLGHSPRRLQ